MNSLKFISTIFGLIIFHFNIFAQAPNFSGTWVLNFDKSNLDKTDDLKGLTGQKFVIDQDDNKFRLKIYHFYGNKESTIGFRMKPDGKIRRVKMIFKGKLEVKDNSLQATMRRKNYRNSVNYKFGENRDELVADEVFTGLPKNHHSIWVFDREKSKGSQSKEYSKNN